MLTASPWDALLNQRKPITLRVQKPAPAARGGTKLALVLRELATGDRTTLSLAVSCDLTPNQVWGLLKSPRADGQVTFENGRWALMPDYPGRDVVRAATLLRSKGWSVEPPEAA